MLLIVPTYTRLLSKSSLGNTREPWVTWSRPPSCPHVAGLRGEHLLQLLPSITYRHNLHGRPSGSWQQLRPQETASPPGRSPLSSQPGAPRRRLRGLNLSSRRSPRARLRARPRTMQRRSPGGRRSWPQCWSASLVRPPVSFELTKCSSAECLHSERGSNCHRWQE